MTCWSCPASGICIEGMHADSSTSHLSCPSRTSQKSCPTKHLAVLFLPLKHPSPWQENAAQIFPCKTRPEETCAGVVQAAGCPGPDLDLRQPFLPQCPPKPPYISAFGIICLQLFILRDKRELPSATAGNLTATPPRVSNLLFLPLSNAVQR